MPICAPWQVEGLSLSSPRPYFSPLKSNILEHDPLELCATIPKLGVHWTLMMPLLCGLGTSQGWAGTVSWSAPFPLLCLRNHYPLAILVWYQDSKVCASLFCFFILIGSKWASWWVIGGDASGTSSGLKWFRQGDNSRRWGLGNMMKLWCHDRHFHERKTQERSPILFHLKTQREGGEKRAFIKPLLHLHLEHPSIKNWENTFLLLIHSGGYIAAAEINWDTLLLLTTLWDP